MPTPRAALILLVAGIAATSVSGQGPREWRDYGGGPDSSRFVALSQITKANVGTLQVAWTYAPGQTDFNPIVANGVIYTRGPGASLVALEAATGKLIWQRDGLEGFALRGVNYWQSADGKARRLIFSAQNFLQEIDAATGEPISSFGTNGRVDL